MTSRHSTGLAALLIAALVVGPAPWTKLQMAHAAILMNWDELTRAPLPSATRRFTYGPAPSQFVDLWLPSGPGPHPVVAMIHGGCWQASVAGLDLMNYIAADLQHRGIAVWNVEYRRLGEPGAGFPGTFRDVAAALDLLAAQADANRLDLARVVAVGHSAGGHLALWAAARTRLSATDPLHGPTPLKLRGVVSLGGLPDLRQARALGDAACGADVVDQLVGEPGPDRPDVYAQTSPVEMLPLGTPQVLIHGLQDILATPAIGQAYVARAIAKGDPARLLLLPDTGHVELIAPQSSAWPREVEEIRTLLGVVSHEADGR